MTSCKDPELRRQVRAELLYPAYDTRTGELIVYGQLHYSQARAAKALADMGCTLHDIATFQCCTVETVRRRLGEAA